MSDLAHTATSNTVIGTGWAATGVSLLAMISPEDVREWAALAQFLAIGGFTLYLSLRKQWETANRESLLARVQLLSETLDEAKAERQELAAKIEQITPPRTNDATNAVAPG